MDEEILQSRLTASLIFSDFGMWHFSRLFETANICWMCLVSMHPKSFILKSMFSCKSKWLGMRMCLKVCFQHNLNLFYSSPHLPSLLDMCLETKSALGTGKVRSYLQWKDCNEIFLGKAILRLYEGSLSL